MIPLNIQRITDKGRGIGLILTWPDNKKTAISSKTLRRHCPCAICKEKWTNTNHTSLPSGRGSLRVLNASTEEETDLKKIQSIGTYAIKILWGDGHSTGIYTFEQLYTTEGK